MGGIATLCNYSNNIIITFITEIERDQYPWPELEFKKIKEGEDLGLLTKLYPLVIFTIES